MDESQLSPHYPKWKYSVGDSKIVKSAEEESALGADWVDHPSQVGLPSAADLDTVAKEAEAKKPVEKKKFF